MFPSPCEELQRSVDAVVRFAANLGRGDTLRLTSIEQLSGCERYTGRWNAIVRKVRLAVLRDRGIALRPITNVGYRLCEHDEQLRYCSRNRQRRAIRQLGRGLLEVDALPPAELTDHQQHLRALMVQQLRTERRQVRRGVRSQQAELRRTETMPARAAG